MLLCVLLSIVLGFAKADIYLHNPRGSNNRLDEGGRNVANQRRLFDSENNNRGGYLVGNMYYYEDSYLNIEWTNQHSCGDENNNCEIIIQYMCGPEVRDGATVQTIPDRISSCPGGNCNNQTEYGMHEDMMYYMRCMTRKRNTGLFTADQTLRHTSARFTRQNPNGERYGYECPEEKGYYPYWHPSPWKDIVVMTNDVTRCDYYKSEGENVKGRGECVFDAEVYKNYSFFGSFRPPTTQAECETYIFRPNRLSPTFKGKWIESPSHGLPAPECIQAPWSRDNHLGNGVGGEHNFYRWKVPKLEDNCVLRIRYNISTKDLDYWKIDSKNNGDADSNNIDFSARFGFADADEAASRGYVYENNPTVQIFPGVELNLAIDTSQFGRTFEDRSFVFRTKSRSAAGIDGSAVIHNVNVRGKRGNIVEVFPSVEYDFVPNTLDMNKGEYVHFQWTGSNSNPSGNDGQGLPRTDRSNIIVMAPEIYKDHNYVSSHTVYGDWGRSYSDTLDADFLGLSRDDKEHLALQSRTHYGGDMIELNDAGTYFDLGPRKVDTSGIFHYMCTRNNAFSNRNQKAKVVVT